MAAAVFEERRLLVNSEVIYLPVDKIAPSPYQPRTVFERETIEELANSIRIYGLIQPVTVRIINGSFYELVAGERRLRASKMAGLIEIPAIIVRINDKDSALLALIENIQRENLNFFDEAESLKNLIDDYGFTQEEIARKIGKNQSTVANKLRILRLPRDVRRLILDNDLTERHARALLRIPQYDTELIHMVLRKIIAGSLNVKETEKIIENALAKNKNDVIVHMEKPKQ
jgi:ParB family chromosome partitioning protein